MRIDLVVLFILLLSIAVSDYKTRVIPDAYILAGITFRILYLIFMRSYTDILKSLGTELLVPIPKCTRTDANHSKTASIRASA